MAFQIDWTSRAEEEVREVLFTIRAENPIAADRFRVRVAERVNALADSPRLGAVYRRRRGFEIRQVTLGNYRIFYRIRPRLRLIEVISVWHAARREPKL